MKALLRENGSDQVLALLGAANPAFTSVITYVECSSAIARTYRERRLSERQESGAAAMLDEYWVALSAVECDQALVRSAGALTRRHSLKAGDAIHLASARTLAGASGPVRFVCWDHRLSTAALELGLKVVPERLP